MSLEISPEKFEKDYIEGYEGLDYIYNEQRGFIVWRRGTGGNVEILHLRAFELQQGYATSLMRDFIEALVENPPYNSVFVFTRKSNEAAIAAYESWGFKMVDTEGIYTEGETAMIGSTKYEDLRKHFNI